MGAMTSFEIRSAFLSFFEERGHTVVPSASLVPASDPTLLFTNAGMVPFKDVFLGREQRGYTRATSSQRCVRAGGKHNDLENVGYTARHHTFFEMLGNFSFGDYFKRDAIHYAWDFLTDGIGLPAERLWVTVFEDDDEAAKIWLEEIGIPESRFARIGAHDNFWSMGPTGPCGPCSEIFYDHGPEVPGGPPGSPDEDGDRYIEVWNLVFMQYDRAEDGTLNPLPSPCVDTGMGLERLAAILQSVHNNFDTDLFTPLIERAAEIAETSDRSSPSLKVVADHMRACAFLITDGVLPSNEGRGYVLRRIIRRAIRHGHQLGIRGLFFHRLVETLDGIMGDAFPELRERRAFVEKVLRQEEERFRETLEDGMALLESHIAKMQPAVLDGDLVFRLYDTHGFPVDLTADIARERGLEIDHEGFEQRMEGQREQSRAASRFTNAAEAGIETEPSTFTGYDSLDDTGRVTALFRDGQAVDALEAGEEGIIVLDQTPFYAEAGGQVGDTGDIRANRVHFRVENTTRSGGHLHHGRMMEGRIGLGDQVTAQVDRARADIRRNHTATHLLHAALREELGDHVHQRGSLVDARRLRFDFSHFEVPSPEQLARIEARVNEWVRADFETETAEMGYDEAIQAGAMALFGEKYGNTVRVVRLGDASMELCGGTHVTHTGEIGTFRLTQETGVAGGVRRVEALTGSAAVRDIQAQDHTVRRIADVLRVRPDEAVDRVAQLSDRVRAQEKEIERLKQKLATQTGRSLTDEAQQIAGVSVLATRVEAAGGKGLRETVDQLKNQLGSGVIVLAAEEDGKVRVVAGVTRDLTDRIRAGDLVNHVAAQVGGKGGGRPDFAQAGGNNPDGIDPALASVAGWVQSTLE